jgi:hypothetical protein
MQAPAPVRASSAARNHSARPIRWICAWRAHVSGSSSASKTIWPETAWPATSAALTIVGSIWSRVLQALADPDSQDVQVSDEVVEVSDRIRLEQGEVLGVEDRCRQQPVHLLHEQCRIRGQALEPCVQVLARRPRQGTDDLSVHGGLGSPAPARSGAPECPDLSEPCLDQHHADVRADRRIRLSSGGHGQLPSVSYEQNGPSTALGAASHRS